MDDQIGRLASRALADWALLDDVRASPPLQESSGAQPKRRSRAGFGTARVILAGFPVRPSEAVALERITREYSEGPTTLRGVTAETWTKETLWDEGGKVGMTVELRSTATKVADGTTLRVVRERMQRTEVKFCPDPQGVSPGTWEYVESQTTSASGPSGNQTARAEVAAAAVLAGHVDDEAELSRVQEEMEVKSRASSGSATRTLTPAIGFTTDGAGNRTATGIDSWEAGEQQFRNPSHELLLMLKGAAILAEQSIQPAYGKARNRWRGRRCVEVAFLEGNARRSVSPGDRVRIVAEARHKEDGGRLPAPLEASLFAYLSITPEKKRIPPPAEFIYRAPDDGTEEATSMRANGARVRVESTSRRGIGESMIEYQLSSGPGYVVRMRVQQEAEKLGTTFDVTYEARLEPGPDGELQGTGTYTGTEAGWMVACSDLQRDPKKKEHRVSGKLKATGSALEMGGNTVIMFTLETLDFPPPIGWSGEGVEEIKGRGTVVSLGLTLTGPVTTKTVTGEGDVHETKCTGKFRNSEKTTVQVLR